MVWTSESKVTFTANENYPLRYILGWVLPFRAVHNTTNPLKEP